MTAFKGGDVVLKLSTLLAPIKTAWQTINMHLRRWAVSIINNNEMRRIISAVKYFLSSTNLK
jgi:hypothetical protein